MCYCINVNFIRSSIKEVSKYVVKDSDFAGSAWVSEFPKLYKALAHVRCFSPAGCWRESRRALGFVDPDADTLTDDVSTGGKIKDFVYLYNCIIIMFYNIFHSF